MSYSIKLTGWRAVVALALLAGFAVFRFTVQRSTLDTQGREVLAAWLTAEYTRAGLARVDASGLPDAESAALLLEAQAVEFRSLSAHGRNRNVVVKAEITVAGRTPPDGRGLRYFRMAHGALSGWSYLHETTAFAYWTRLW